MRARELMTSPPACCTPDTTIRQAAELMAEHDCGSIPVVQDTTSNRIVGVVTDRDIAIRCVAEGKDPDTRVKEAMSENPECCSLDAEVDAVEKIMIRKRVRRVPIVDGNGCCVGIIAQADLALDEAAATDSELGRVVEQISVPAGHAG